MARGKGAGLGVIGLRRGAFCIWRNGSRKEASRYVPSYQVDSFSTGRRGQNFSGFRLLETDYLNGRHDKMLLLSGGQPKVLRLFSKGIFSVTGRSSTGGEVKRRGEEGPVYFFHFLGGGSTCAAMA